MLEQFGLLWQQDDATQSTTLDRKVGVTGGTGTLGVAPWNANTRESHHPSSQVSRQPGVLNTWIGLASCQTGFLDGFMLLLPGTSLVDIQTFSQ